MNDSRARELTFYVPENASSGKTRRSRSLGLALLRTASARLRLLSMSPTCVYLHVSEETFGAEMERQNRPAAQTANKQSSSCKEGMADCKWCIGHREENL